MALTAAHWQGNARLNNASENKPSLKPGDPNATAVQVFQNVLLSLQFGMKAGADGSYGSQTSAAVREVEKEFKLGLDQGVAGKEVLTVLDRFLLDPSQFGAGRASGRTLALTDVPLARSKVSAALKALVDLDKALFSSTPGAADPVTIDALRVHFRLTQVPGTTGVTRVFTQTDLNEIRATFTATRGILDGASARFVDFMPENGPLTAAEAPFGGNVRFGPVYRNFDRRGLGLIGKESRAAILIHECTHAIDAVSGNDTTTHISEFDPRYPGQPPEFAKHNPSSYATFAAHIVSRKDPDPRPGLGPLSRGAGGA